MDRTNQRRVVEVTPEALIDHFKTGSKVECVDGLPEDCRVLGSGYDYEKRVFYIDVWSEDFEPKEEGEKIPKEIPEFKSHR